MRRMLTVVAAASAVALVGAAAPAGAKLAKRAYFRLDVSASQRVVWSGKTLLKSCGDSVVDVTSGGRGDVDAHDLEAPWAVARRTSDRRGPTLLVHGEGAAFAAGGIVSRDGHVSAVFAKPPSDPSQCPKPLPGSPDCGLRYLPEGAQMYVSYLMPRAWTYPGPKPSVPMLLLSGPYVAEWAGMPPFQFCPGANGDDTLAGTWYDPNARPMAAALPLAKLFGTAKRFSVSYANTRTVQTAQPVGNSVLADDHPVTTTIHWTVRFTRLAHPQLETPDL